MFTKPNIQNKSIPPNKTVNNTRFYDNIALFYCGVSGVSSLAARNLINCSAVTIPKKKAAAQ